MNLLDVLAAGPPAYAGRGVNHENEPFSAALKIQALEGGRALLLGYVATLDNGTVVHSESTLLGTGPDGNLWLWPVMPVLLVVLPHKAIVTSVEAGSRGLAVFASGPRDDAAQFREEITLQVDTDGSLVYAHAWGLPGGEFGDRSSCRLVPVHA